MLIRTVRSDGAVIVDLNGGNASLRIALGKCLLQECFIDSNQVILVVRELLQLGQLQACGENDQ